MSRMTRLMRRWLTADGRALAKRLEAIGDMRRSLEVPPVRFGRRFPRAN